MALGWRQLDPVVPCESTADSNGDFLADTWIWDGTNWTQMSPANNPAGRAGSAMVYDSIRGQVVLFGGQGAYGVGGSETWTWDGTNWTQQSPANSPPARSLHVMAYDPALGLSVVFGGYNEDGAFYNDTWTWDGTNWMQLSPATSPSFVLFGTMDYEPSDGQLLLFGGDGNSGLLNNTWYFGAPVAVPNVVGDTQAAATSAITSAGLVLGTVTTQSSGTVASGDVISQSPAGNTQANFGSAVDLVVSSGPPQYVLTIAASPSAGGTVTPTSGGSYTQGSAVPISASPASGYAFTGWTSAPGLVASASSASTTITMNAAETVTANFTAYAVAASTTTVVNSSNNPSFTAPPGNSTTFTATVTSTSTVSLGSVSFTNNGTQISGCTGVPVSNGTAQCSTSFTTEGSPTITATYSGYSSFSVSYLTGYGIVTQLAWISTAKS